MLYFINSSFSTKAFTLKIECIAGNVAANDRRQSGTTRVGGFSDSPARNYQGKGVTMVTLVERSKYEHGNGFKPS